VTGATPKIAFAGISHTFAHPSGPVDVVRDVDLHVFPGELVSIVGPSGCGKTTLFNIAAGLLEPDRGRVLLDGVDQAGQRGHVGYMLQKDLLLPWRTVLANVVLGLEVRGVPRREAQERARPLLERFGLDGFEHHYPSQLSGGMRQRAALMRTMLFEPDVLILDEPFGALDAQTRGLMQEWLLTVKAEFDKTVLLVTHDVEEAVLLSNRIYVMTARPGRIKDCVTVDLPYPRTVETVTDPAFVAIKHSVLTTLRDEVRRAFGQSAATVPP
jgi:ABC-type nitrate/sulfonate/bicarbonate transport system ATPase subunit